MKLKWEWAGYLVRQIDRRSSIPYPHGGHVQGKQMWFVQPGPSSGPIETVYDDDETDCFPLYLSDTMEK